MMPSAAAATVAAGGCRCCSPFLGFVGSEILMGGFAYI